MTRAKRAFVHVGLDKTGTTALQAWCARNEEQLLSEAGLLYPGEGRRWNHHIEVANHCGFGLKADVARAKRDRRRYQELRAFFFSCGEHDLLLSSEHFSYSLSDEAALSLKFMLAAYDEVHVILVLRTPADWLRSKYAEAVKWGGVARFDVFVAEHCSGRGSMSGALMFWLNGFDRGRTHVVFYDETREALVQGVLGVVDPRLAQMDSSDVGEANPSIGAADIEVMKCCSEAMNLERGVGAYEFFRFYQSQPKPERLQSLNGASHGANFSDASIALIELENQRLINFLPDKREIIEAAHQRTLSAPRAEIGPKDMDYLEQHAERVMEAFHRAGGGRE